MKPTAKTLELVRNLATLEDGWMTPTDDFTKVTDFEEYQEEQRVRWEETEHFRHFYGQTIKKLGYDDAYSQGFKEEDYREAELVFFEEFYEPLKTAFWEQWGEIHNIKNFYETRVK